MELFTIIVTSFIAAIATNWIGYLKEKKIASSKYTEEVLEKIYVPIYNILIRNIHPGDGYEGIDVNQVKEIYNITEENPQFLDPKLNSIVWRLKEEIYHYQHSGGSNYYDTIYDLDRKLIDYILVSFNKTRRSLGLPNEKRYSYPLAFKIVNSYSKLQRKRWLKKYSKKKR